MGQRGYRKRRSRCAFVDQRSGLRCRSQVKRAGNTYCGLPHAYAARRVTPRPGPGAEAKRQAARRRALEALGAELRAVADDMGRVPLPTVLAAAEAHGERRYAQGYHAGLMTGRKRTRKMRLTASRAVLDEFLGSKFGKGFVTGQLSLEKLAGFGFGGTRR